MDIPLLQTKLYIPTAHSDLISRAHLLEQLNQGLQRKLVLISAPAGFGKTTLISTWIDHLVDAGTDAQVAWLSLDDNDNDLSQFFTYLVAAFHRVEPGMGQNIQSLLIAPQPASPDHLATLLVNDLAQSNQSIILIFDDYHHIRNQKIHQSVTFLLDNLPPNGHLAMTTRRDPPLPLARLRARRDLVEIREHHLRFTDDEALQFFQQVADLEIDNTTVQGLCKRTEGWVSGLQMAAISLVDNPQQADFIAGFTGSHHFVADYLMDEVLARQPQGIQDFLLQTAVLDRFEADLCNAVRQKTDSQTLIGQIEGANLFLIRLDANRNWYRYHHLFRDFLRHRLHRQHPDWVFQCHQRASQWFEQNGLIPEAIDTALAVDDYDNVADLIEHIAQSSTVRLGQWATLLNWIQALPADLIKARPHLRLNYAWALMAKGQAATAEKQLQAIEKSIAEDAPDKEVVIGKTAAIRATAARMRGDLQQTIALSQQALDHLPENDYFGRSSTALNLGTIHFLSDDLEAAEQALLEAQSASRQANTISFLLVTMGYLGQLSVRRGALRQAAQIYRQTLEVAQSPDTAGQFVNTLGLAYIGLGELEREWHNLDAALSHLKEGLRLGRLADNGLILISGTITMARVKQAQGDFTAALDHIHQVEELTREAVATWTWMTVSNAAYLARLWVRQGQLEKANNLVQAFKQTGEPAYIAQSQNLATITLWLAQGRASDALSIIEKMKLDLAQSGQNGTFVELLVLQALALAALKRTPDALETLISAINLAEPEGYKRLFLDVGNDIVPLLRQLPQTPYLEQLLEHFVPADEATPQGQLSSPPPQTLIDPLSDRELQILRLMSARLSNPEIAAELYLATTTIKWYSRQIYSKLGVNNRRAAVERAEELNLL